MVGYHRSPYHGFSVEFSEHRAYGPGDEIKHIDWKLYGKTDRYYVKRFEEETNLRSYILLDTSRSMAFASGKVSKLEYGQMIAAALAYLLLNQQDAVGLGLFSTDLYDLIPSRGTRSHLNVLLSRLDRCTPAGETAVGPVLHALAERFKKRGLILLISDLLDRPDALVQGLKHFRHNRQEVIVFHLLDPRELDFRFSTRTRFRDAETGEVLTTEPWQIQDIYRRKMDQFRTRLRRECGAINVDYVFLTTEDRLDIVLREFLRKRQRLL
ncbi:MAG: DUF58 domain-containing protein [Candidatus Neomarinimicrobiota bacterium]|nr:MAG: DUF58 domain-containing protein [Candidatus Neomarinimicrobiota bacterium]